MNLEDHLGDILRKARRAAGLPLEAVAQAAGLSEPAYAALEESGQVPGAFAMTSSVPRLSSPSPHATRGERAGERGAGVIGVERGIPSLNRVASLLGLDAAKLEGIAAGWLPKARDLGRWRHLEVISTTEGGNAVNACLVWDPNTREAALFDTGWEARPILGLIEQHRLSLRYILITHSHHDHVAALEPVRRAAPTASLLAGSRQPLPPAGLALGRFRISRQVVSGHAGDGVIYVVGGWPEAAPSVAIVGDTIFAGSIASGFISWEVLKQQVHDHILGLPLDTLICPGHGPVTTVAEEQAHNPFFGAPA